MRVTIHAQRLPRTVIMCKAADMIVCRKTLDVPRDAYAFLLNRSAELEFLQFSPEHQLALYARRRQQLNHAWLISRLGTMIIVAVAVMCYTYDVRRFIALFLVSFVVGLFAGFRNQSRVK